MEKDTKIPVKIVITGTHIAPDEVSSNAPDETKEEAFGFLSKRGNSIYLVYETQDINETAGIIISNMIKISPDSNEIKKTSTFRQGTITSPASCLVYRQGRKLTGFYSTPYGRLDTETTTTELFVSETENGLTCHIKGSMEINNSPVSEFDLKVEAAKI